MMTSYRFCAIIMMMGWGVCASALLAAALQCNGGPLASIKDQPPTIAFCATTVAIGLALGYALGWFLVVKL